MAMDGAIKFWLATTDQGMITSSYGHIVIRDFNQIAVRRAPVIKRGIRQKEVKDKSEFETDETIEVSGYQDTS